ncbi:MAG: DCC1-like thiol-disulfide oxidoreductase family protein [Myxococcota bacterium]
MGRPERLVLYDGDCGLCQKSVQWLLDHDTEGKLRFAPLQGETAKPILQAHEELEGVDSVVYVEGDEAFVRSRPIFKLSAHLDKRWRWLRHLQIIPAFLSDLGYRFIAAIRYKVWGHADVCRIPTPEERARLLP